MPPHKRERPEFDETPRKPESGQLKFDRTISLGHLLTALLMFAGGVGVWTNLQVVSSRQDTRLNYMERDQTEMRSLLKQQSEIQYKLAGALEMLARKQP